MVNLGEPCRHLWGKHYGKPAWINADKLATKEKFHVVVLEKSGDYIKTTAYKHMIRKGHQGGSKNTLEEAAFDQIPELEEVTSSLCTKLAKCKITHSKQLSTMIKERLIVANKRQMAKGPKALWYHIDHDDKKRGRSRSRSRSTSIDSKQMVVK